MANKTLLKGTMESIIACIVIVFILLLVVLRNFWMSVIAIVPIVLCLVVNFGYLGFSGTELNTATALVSSIGIGIGVDFSIHFITWYRRELQVDRRHPGGRGPDDPPQGQGDPVQPDRHRRRIPGPPGLPGWGPCATSAC